MPPKAPTPTLIRNPRRLLILSPSSHSPSIIPPLLHSLTGIPVTTPPTTTTTTTTTTAPPHPETDPKGTTTATLSDAETLAPSPSSSVATLAPPPTAAPLSTTTFAGYTTHPPLHIKNRYYTADIPIWVDEIPLSASSSSSAPPSAAPSASSSSSSGGGPSVQTEEAQSTTPQAWKTEFSSPEAQVVRDAIGAVVICFRNPVALRNDIPDGNRGEDVEERDDVRRLKAFVRAVGEVRGLIEEERGGLGVAEVPGVVVLVGEKERDKKVRGGAERGENGEGMLGEEPFSVGWWEDQVCEMGLMGMEVVRWDGNASASKEGEGEGRNVYGELQGMRRIKEVLETHDWAAAEGEDGEGMGSGLLDEDDLERELLGLDEGEHGFDLEVNELEREMVGLRMTIERGGRDGFEDDDDDDDGEQEIENEELRVDAVEALLLRMRAIKDISDDLPEAERKRFAAKAVRDIMKEL
ncbi:hypothetical protein BO71DRAFT_348436 [Aspergillus ellipticus CBS 707.79]|uniref:Alpha and gamma adaptin binding protein p34 n=1 Tax=Aspergillus ellipticus CBS 707.79 TaxID=1448320 RepID=A0A319E837_9EURO|nr:hypothetical protein BO71DRAFT_348436 [Aspergillus ellipticus CBS 707.79]